MINEENIDKETKLETIDQYIKELTKEYNLDTSENNTLIDSLAKYTYAIEKYHIYEVGYTKDNNKKIELINKYNLSNKDIEESFFVNINYENHSLIGRNSEEFKRRKSIKKLVNIWNDIDDNEKQELIKNNSLKYPEDYNIISIMRNKINHLQDISNKKINYL